MTSQRIKKLASTLLASIFDVPKNTQKWVLKNLEYAGYLKSDIESEDFLDLVDRMMRQKNIPESNMPNLKSWQAKFRLALMNLKMTWIEGGFQWQKKCIKILDEIIRLLIDLRDHS
jgi:hypothetical protein